jgi:Domain of unknown function (DUF1707)
MCGRRQMAARDPDLRVSQVERDRVVERLRANAGDGRLDMDELEERVEAALAAKTWRELEVLVADLPRERPPRPPRAAVRAVAAGSLAGAALPLLGGIAVIALAPAGFAWIGWTAIGWWFFAALPSAGFGFAWCGWAKRRRQRGVFV